MSPPVASVKWMRVKAMSNSDPEWPCLARIPPGPSSTLVNFTFGVSKRVPWVYSAFLGPAKPAVGCDVISTLRFPQALRSS